MTLGFYNFRFVTYLAFASAVTHEMLFLEFLCVSSLRAGGIKLVSESFGLRYDVMRQPAQRAGGVTQLMRGRLLSVPSDSERALAWLAPPPAWRSRSCDRFARSARVDVLHCVRPGPTSPHEPVLAKRGESNSERRGEVASAVRLAGSRRAPTRISVSQQRLR